MSRRSHHPARRHVRTHPDVRAPRPAQASDAAATSGGEATGGGLGLGRTQQLGRTPQPAAPAAPPQVRDAAPTSRVEPRSEAPRDAAVIAAPRQPAPAPAPHQEAATVAAPRQPAPAPTTSQRLPGGQTDAERNGCTAPQLRRFIKSRAYVPMHELRRRFAIEGTDDDVTPVDMDPGVRVFVGLPNREGRLLGELLRSGDIGYELSFDPISPIVVGVFPMRPVPRA